MIARAILGVAVAAGLTRLLAADAGTKRRKRATTPVAKARAAGTAGSQRKSSKQSKFSKPRTASAKTVKSRTVGKPVRKK